MTLPALVELLPIQPQTLSLGHGPVGLIVVDAGVAFTRRGALADPEHMVPMVHRIGHLWHDLDRRLGERLHTLCFLDTHHADIPEPPYPPHGVIGSGEEDIDPDLAWLLERERVVVIRKDCINGFVGAIDRESGRNALCEWVRSAGLHTVLVVGDCTDICVSDLVVAMLSARNHGLFTSADPTQERARYVADITTLRIAVLPEGCDTYHAPGVHDRAAAHHVGLWLMAARGAILVSSIAE